LPATDLHKALDFYHLMLGLPAKFDFSEKGMVAFTVGDQEPALILRTFTIFLAQRQQSGFWSMA